MAKNKPIKHNVHKNLLIGRHFLSLETIDSEIVRTYLNLLEMRPWNRIWIIVANGQIVKGHVLGRSSGSKGSGVFHHGLVGIWKLIDFVFGAGISGSRRWDEPELRICASILSIDKGVCDAAAAVKNDQGSGHCGSAAFSLLLRRHCDKFYFYYNSNLSCLLCFPDFSARSFYLVAFYQESGLGCRNRY